MFRTGKYIAISMIILFRLKALTPLVTNPHFGNSAIMQNPPISDSSLYIVVTLEVIKVVKNPFFYLGRPKAR